MLLLVLTGGCDGDPTCKQALSNAANVLDLRKSEITLQIGACEQESWPAEARRCLHQAKTKESLSACAAKLGKPLAGGGADEDAAGGDMKRAKKPEAMIQLNKIAKLAVIEYMTNARFPTVAAPLTPAVGCCAQNALGKKKCEVVAADWNTPTWRALDFSLDKEFYYQYSYTPGAGGATFVATAVGDLDCDGTTVTFTVEGSSVNGTPKTTITEPPPNSD